MTQHITPGWRFVSIDVEGADVSINGVNPWTHEREWTRTREDPIAVAHPSYPSQRHPMHIYELVLPERQRIRFAAGEFSNGVWGFYVPQ